MEVSGIKFLNVTILCVYDNISSLIRGKILWWSIEQVLMQIRARRLNTKEVSKNILEVLD